MKSITGLCAATALSLALTACNQAPAPAPNTHDADVKAIQDNETQWNADWAARDAAKASAHYTDDAVLMVSGGPPTVGKDAIQKMGATMLADPTTSLKFQSSKVDVASSGDLGYSQGTYTLTVTDPTTKKPTTDHGSYVTVYRKQTDGSWKAVEDSVTSEVPPAAPAKKK